MQKLYILEDSETKLLKIGKASDITQRLRNLRTANPRLTLVHSVDVEQNSVLEAYIHNRFAMHRKQGEFFDISKEIVIQEINNALQILCKQPSKETIDQIASLQHLQSPRSVRQDEEELFNELLKIRSELEKLSLREAVLLDQLKLAIGEHSGIKNWATYKLFARNRMNLEAMRIECPNIIEKYTITTFSRTLRIRRFINQNEELQ
jgi:hypothetical protein